MQRVEVLLAREAEVDQAERDLIGPRCGGNEGTFFSPRGTPSVGSLRYGSAPAALNYSKRMLSKAWRNGATWLRSHTRSGANAVTWSM